MQRSNSNYYQSTGRTSRPRATSDQANRPIHNHSRGQRHLSSSSMPYHNFYDGYGSTSQNIYTTMAPISPSEQDLAVDDVFGHSMFFQNVTLPVDMARRPSQHGSRPSQGSPNNYLSPQGNHYEVDPTPGFMGVPDNGISMSARSPNIVGRHLNTPPEPIYRENAYTASVSTRSAHPGQFSDSGMPTTPMSEPDAGMDFHSPAGAFDPSLNGLSISPNHLMPNDGAYQGYGMSQEDSPIEYGDMQSTTHDMAQTGRNHPERTSRSKEHWCDVDGCTHGRPFGTRNDLDRHRFSKHHFPAEGQKVYVCQGRTCLEGGRNREWPRKDNFKSHCKSAHKDEDLDELIKRSERCNLSKPPSSQSKDFAGNSVPELWPSTAKLSAPKSEPPGLHLILSTDDTTSTKHVRRSQDGQYLSPVRNSSRMPVQTSACTQRSGKRRKRDSDDYAYRERHLEIHKPHDNVLGRLAETLHTFSPKQQRLFQNYSHNLGKLPAEFHNMSGKYDGFCPVCCKLFTRLCDLRKHMNRHVRPWGCTDSDCSKKFGSKNDWKRHEYLLHSQEECFVCGEQDPDSPRTDNKRCIFVSPSRREFIKHLEERHGKIDEQYHRVQEEARRLGAHWSGTMWCGFCEDVIRHRTKGIKQWKERFDHIDKLHFKEGQTIEDWYPPNSHYPKRMTMEASTSNNNVTDSSDELCSSDDEHLSVAEVPQTSELDAPIDPQLPSFVPLAAEAELGEGGILSSQAIVHPPIEKRIAGVSVHSLSSHSLVRLTNNDQCTCRHANPALNGDNMCDLCDKTTFTFALDDSSGLYSEAAHMGKSLDPPSLHTTPSSIGTANMMINSEVDLDAVIGS